MNSSEYVVYMDAYNKIHVVGPFEDIQAAHKWAVGKQGLWDYSIVKIESPA